MSWNFKFSPTSLLFVKNHFLNFHHVTNPISPISPDFYYFGIFRIFSIFLIKFFKNRKIWQRYGDYEALETNRIIKCLVEQF